MKLVAFEMPDDWKFENTLISSDMSDKVYLKNLDRDGVNDPPSFEAELYELDAIKVGEIYSSEDYKIVTETEGDHMLFKVLRRSDV